MFAPKLKAVGSSTRSLANRPLVLAQRTSNLNRNDLSEQDERQADSASLTARGATSGASWDFSKIPVFPPEPANRTQPSSPSAAAPLPGAIQAKLAIGSVDDPLEHEADRVADQVMRMPDLDPSVTSAPPQVSRKCAACEEEERVLQAKPAELPKAAAREVPHVVDEVLRSPGQPIDTPTRIFMEQRIGYDFSDVRVHNNARAASSARAINARAYTLGNDLVFGAGQYSPNSNEGKHLLARD